MSDRTEKVEVDAETTKHLFPHGEKVDLTDYEYWREYVYPGGEVYRIINPQFLIVSESGGHRVYDGIRAHYIKPGWNVVRWECKPGHSFVYVKRMEEEEKTKGSCVDFNLPITVSRLIYYLNQLNPNTVVKIHDTRIGFISDIESLCSEVDTSKPKYPDGIIYIGCDPIGANGLVY